MAAAIISALGTNKIALFRKSQYAPCSGEFKEWKIPVIYPKSNYIPETLYPATKLLKTMPLHVGEGKILYKVYVNNFNGILLCRRETLESIIEMLTSNYILRSDYDKGLLQTLYSLGIVSDKPSLEHPVRIIHKKDLHKKILENIEDVIEKVGWFTLVPETVEIEITRRCNFRCIHCCRECPTNEEDFDKKDLIKIIRNLGNLGSIGLTLTGGEPLLYERVVDILKEAKSNYLSITILTNGSKLANYEFLEKIIKYVGAFQFSIYGPSAEIHDRVTKVKGSFSMLLKALENIIRHSKFREGKISINFNYVIIRGINDEPHILEEVIRAFSVLPAKIRFTSVVPEGRGKDLTIYTPNDLRRVGEYIRKLAEKYNLKKKLIVGGLPSLSAPYYDALVFGCPAARDFMFIGLEKYASPCDTVYNYNRVPIEKDNILEAWLSNVFFKYREPPKENCPFKYVCGGPCKYDFISQSKNR